MSADQLRSLVKEATPGRWRVDDDWSDYGGVDRGSEGSGWVTPHGAYSDNRADNVLMALAPQLALLVADMAEFITDCDPTELHHTRWPLLHDLLARLAALFPEDSA